MGRAFGRGFAAILVVAVAAGSAAAAHPPASRLIVRATDGSWHGVLVANPATSGCRRIALPDPDLFSFAIAGSRVAYPSNSGRGRWIWVGTIGGRMRKLRTQRMALTPPVFVGRRVAYVPASDPRRIVFVGGGSLAPALPAHASIRELAAHGNRVALYATWDDALISSTSLQGALFLFEHGKTTKVENEPDPLGEEPEPVWSPDGTRIAVIRNGQLWTMRPDGSLAKQVSNTPPAATIAAYNVVWSPDSRRIAFAVRRNRAFDVYEGRATGGRETRLTTTARSVPRGTIPLAWLGNWIAVARHNSLGIVPAGGGQVNVLCRPWSKAPAGWGRATWIR